MQVKHKTDELLPCITCGFKPDHVNIGYGRTPYDVWCPVCKKQSEIDSKFHTTGMIDNAIALWNDHVRLKTKEELDQERKEAQESQKQDDPYGEYRIYQWYWWAKQNPELIKSTR